MTTRNATELKAIDRAELEQVEGGLYEKAVMIPTPGTLKVFEEAGYDDYEQPNYNLVPGSRY
jgi:hypothetical protein